ncbi:MAG: sulfotransferase [Candidatus Binatia bacterium]
MAEAVLDTDWLVARAQTATGLKDLGEPSWREGLQRYVAALREEAALTPLGVQFAAGEILMYLANRLSVTDWHSRYPAIAARDVRPPIVIVGMGRTGTTILHDLLAQDPAHRAPLTWEVDQPCPPPETATYDTDPRIAEAQARIDRNVELVPALQTTHPLGALLAQECIRLMGADFRSIAFGTQYRIPSYCHWLLYQADMAPTYRWHRRFLQLLQWRHHAERWVLKSPGHLWALPTLLAEYPNALLVQTHRDPLFIIASLGSLMGTLRGLTSDHASMREAATEFADYVVDGLNRAVAARQDGTVATSRVVDVQFRSFMADPFLTIRGIYERLEIELTPAAEQRMRRFLAEHARDKHGRHQYRFADTGLDAVALRERVRRYQEYFDVPSEPLP